MTKSITMLFIISACSFINPISVFNQNKEILVKITKIQIDSGVDYLYGTVGNKKIRIATFNGEYYKKNVVYSLELYSLKRLLIEYNIIPTNYLDVDLSKFAIQINDTISISLMNRNYNDLFLTSEIKENILKIIMQTNFR